MMNDQRSTTQLIGSRNPDENQRACITYVRMNNSPDYLRSYSHFASNHYVGPIYYGIIENNIEVAYAYGSSYEDAKAKIVTYWKGLTNTERQQKLSSVGIEIDSPSAHEITDEILS